MKQPQAKMHRKATKQWGRQNEFMKRLKRLTELLDMLQYENGRALPVLLLILLLLVAAGGYIFYFTDLVVKHGQGNETLSSSASLVKKPLPPRPGIQTAARDEKPPVAHQQAAVDSKAKAGAGKTAPVKISEQKTITPAKNSKKRVSGKARAEEKLEKLTTAKPVGKGGPESKPVVIAKNVKKTKEPAKKQAEAEPSKPSVRQSTGPEKGKYTLLIGVYVMKKSMAPEKAKLKTAGLKPGISKGPKKLEPMNRLLIGSFDSYSEASLESKKLAKATEDAFILPEKGKFAVYAGSYFEKGRAISEHDRLTKAGLKSEIVQTKVPVNTFKLTAGSFASRELADKEALRLKKLGLAASVTGSGI
jgi:cell division protein FtsN